MRRVSKPWPPANVSPDGQETCTLVDAERSFLSTLVGAANKTACAETHYNQLDKCKLRAVLYQEQGAICIYCEQRVEEGSPTPRIDHWRPRNHSPELALKWQNLHLSCATPETCDCRKRGLPLRWNDTDDDLPWPSEFAYEDVLGFTSRGEIYVRTDANLDAARRKALELALDDCLDGNTKRPAILNLNHPTLVAARAAALDSERTKLQKEFEEATVSRDERAQRANALVASDPLPQFVSIRVAWLKKTLGKGR